MSISYIEDILLHIHNTIIKIWKLTLMWYSIDLTQIFSIVLTKKKSSARSSPRTCIAFSYHVSSVSFNLEYFLSLCPLHWYFWRTWSSCLVECAPGSVCCYFLMIRFRLYVFDGNSAEVLPSPVRQLMKYMVSHDSAPWKLNIVNVLFAACLLIKLWVSWRTLAHLDFLQLSW